MFYYAFISWAILFCPLVCLSCAFRMSRCANTVKCDHPLDERDGHTIKYRCRNLSQHLSIVRSFSLQSHFALARSPARSAHRLTLPFAFCSSLRDLIAFAFILSRVVVFHPNGLRSLVLPSSLFLSRASSELLRRFPRTSRRMHLAPSESLFSPTSKETYESVHHRFVRRGYYRKRLNETRVSFICGFSRTFKS